MKILHLTLKKKWFDLIASGKKKSEYRELKEHWRSRFLVGISQVPKKFDEVHFRNGYNKNSPFMRVEWKGLDSGIFEGKPCYEIKLGKVLEIKNYSLKKYNK